VEVNGKRFEVDVWVPESAGVGAASAALAGARPRRARRPTAGGAGGGAVGSGNVTVPMQGTIVKVLVEVGHEVEAGQAVVVLEAMKMENQIAAEKSGTIKEIKVVPGDTVGGGDVVAVID
jgi:acetyl-CoA/propionyl-CoA/long-chain acyl-CoA carboxylase, biotin carboxylase, biotin carboxyl carrier protein